MKGPNQNQLNNLFLWYFSLYHGHHVGQEGIYLWEKGEPSQDIIKANNTFYIPKISYKEQFNILNSKYKCYQKNINETTLPAYSGGSSLDAAVGDTGSCQAASLTFTHRPMWHGCRETAGGRRCAAPVRSGTSKCQRLLIEPLLLSEGE